ncbi:DUF2147 domain-containing protein [Bradyrhizobium sp. AUGA SZCCT0283]|uniref:DUF2147 domain-containing protein n=1 Tax=Bradyrhizobium sp. AUGA SZCCT0283 TaxID=2807671 RepID=UPI001BACE214|nr:DUF2147 domain-containing protein [Bradyrhizobium sp. AUGA SZCCT0283]MBR1273956.1 DUF2147 domain-containing protein [Bradyrhizobium sp. AUGA SZCCT0283]
MKRFCFLAVLIALSSSAHAGRSISFSVGSHRVHIESSRHCRSVSCASMSISRSLDWRRKRDRHDDDRGVAAPAKPVPPAPQTVSPPAPPATTAPAKTIVAAPPPAVYTPAASRSQIVDAPPPPAPPAPPPVQEASIPVPPLPPVAKPVETAQPAPQVERVSHQAEEEPSDSPIGDWQTEGKGTVRIAKCGNALCGFVLGSSNEKGEAILINMKPKTERQWTGGVYSQDSGETYYGTMSMKGINTLRVEACALGRFYCSGNNWSRITRRADSLVTSRQVSAEQRS